MVRLADEHDKSELKRLWINVFKDSDQFFESFYKNRFSSSIVYIIEDEHEIISAAWYMKSKYYYEEELRDCYFIVGVATHEEYQRQGHMKSLLDHANNELNCPCFLFPAVRSYYEKLGFVSANAFVFDLSYRDTPQISFSEFDIKKLDELYTSSIMLSNGLVRDEIAWKDLEKVFNVLILEESYMLVLKETGEIVEAVALDKHSSLLIYPYLYGKVTVIPHSPLEELLIKKQKSYTKTLLGMSNNGENVYIREQY